VVLHSHYHQSSQQHYLVSHISSNFLDCDSYLLLLFLLPLHYKFPTLFLSRLPVTFTTMLPATPMNIFLDHHARRRHAQQSNSNNHNTSSTMTDTKLPRSILSTSVVRNGATNDDGNRNRNSNNDTYANANANNNRRHHNSHNNNHHQPEKPQSQSQDSVMHCDTTDPAGDSDDYEIDDCQEDDNDDDDDDDEFRLTIPSLLLTHTHESLAQMDQTVLAKCLNPVMESLRMLDAESLLNLQRVDNGARLCDGYVNTSKL